MTNKRVVFRKVALIRKCEKRKQKSREAARRRRSQEVKIFTEMANLLPISKNLSSKLDKASILRLTIAFIKLKSLLDNSDHELFGMWNDDDECSMTDPCWPQALGGMLLALTSEGDIIHLTENVIQEVGLPQLNLIGKSIYDYCHPCDHSELRQVLTLRPDGELVRTFDIRLKSTLTAKRTRNKNQKEADYKVMNCSGRIVLATSSNIRINNSLEGIFKEKYELREKNLELLSIKYPTSHFLVVISDPISSPSNLKMSLENCTFITHHTMDMKYTHIDEMIGQFLGYTPEDLIGRSEYEFHHPQDSESITKSYKTMLRKGQTQTPPYRFLAKHGGYAWVQTQATKVSVRNGNIIPQAIVCAHVCLSEIEESDQILCISQAEAAAAGSIKRLL